MEKRKQTPPWPVRNQSDSARCPLLVLDFDGTLAPIRREPQKVRMPAYMAEALHAARLAGLGIIILSGRPVSFLRRMGLDRRIRLMGNFGNKEVGRAGAGARWKDEARVYSVLARLRAMPGVRIEKKTGWAVHYRQAAKKKMAAIMREIGALKAAAGPKAVVVMGRLAVELLPPGSKTKADALRGLLRANPGRSLIFVGDDWADLDAMQKLRQHPRFFARLLRSSEVRAGRWPPVIKNRPALARWLRRLGRTGA